MTNEKPHQYPDVTVTWTSHGIWVLVIAIILGAIVVALLPLLNILTTRQQNMNGLVELLEHFDEPAHTATADKLRTHTDPNVGRVFGSIARTEKQILQMVRRCI